MKPLLSIVVPVYNVVDLIEKCLDSILNQTFKNFELILVDDCSTDGSREICEIYGKKDSRIKLILCNKNVGQSLARNKGLDVAHGKYIGFVDSDDSICKEMYENLINEMEKGFDLSVCGRVVVKSCGERMEVKTVEEKFYFEEEELKYRYMCQEFIHPHTVVVYNKVYRRDIIEKLNLRFEDLRVVGTEDMLFNYIYILNIKSLKSIAKEHYIGYAREGSTMRKYNPGYMKRFANLVEVFSKYNEDSQLDRVKIILCIYFFEFYIRQVKSFSSNEEFYKNLDLELKVIVKNDSFKSLVRKIVFTNSYIKDLKIKKYRFLGIIYIKILYMSIYLNLNRLTYKLVR